MSGLLALLRVLARLGLFGCLRVLSLRVLALFGVLSGCGVLAGLGLSCRRRVLALLRVLAAHGLDGVLALRVLAALGLGLLAVAHDNECGNAADDNDCQDEQEDSPRAGR